MFYGTGGRVRTADLTRMKRPLYHLSYSGSELHVHGKIGGRAGIRTQDRRFIRHAALSGLSYTPRKYVYVL